MARSVSADININGQNVSGYITPFLESLTYTDVLEGEASTAEITLEDTNCLWRSQWFPARGDTMSITLIRRNWNEEGQVETLPLNAFEVDEIVCSAPPNRAKIKLNSIANNSQIRSVARSQSWENTRLSRIAADVAGAAGMALYYDAADDPLIERAEQDEESGLKFLFKMSKDAGLLLKVEGEALIICDEEKYEARSAAVTLSYGDVAIKNFRATATINEIYSSAVVRYKHGRQGELIEGRYKAGGKSGGMTLRINQKVSSAGEAQRLARKKLREKNREEIKVELECIGNFVFVAGNVFELKDFGAFDGNYLIERAVHQIGNGYSCRISARRCLGY